MEMELEQSNQEPLTFEKMLMLFRETREMMRESSRETREMMQVSSRETALRFKDLENLHKKNDEEHQAAKKELERIERIQQKKYKQLESMFTGQWGKLVESLVEGKLVYILKQRNIDVKETYTRIESPEKDMELDIIAANGKDVVVVEVKTTLKIQLVDEFLEKLERFRALFPRFAEENIFGAVAFLRDEASAAKYAQKKGLFIIKATGDSASIANRENFIPKNW
ncbi:MAG TPA: hypothetical protein PKY56_09435 [Candidatus Kapabacteria bacterium]|nr:hypothetical protein [Candidatus Kapabacteria bacterium]